jgi:hypothetical protein
MFIARLVKGQSGKQSMLIKLDDVFPECQILIKDTSLTKLCCWTNPGSCHRGSFTTDMSIVVERVYRIFYAMPHLDLIVLYWSAPHPNAPKKTRRWGLVIDRDENKEMRVNVLNKWAIQAVSKGVGKAYSIDMDL